MRAYQILYLLIFILFYILISLGTAGSLSKITSHAKRKKVRIFILCYSVLIIACFIFLFIWPKNARNTGDYTWYIIYNALLSIDFVFKIPLAFSYVIGFAFHRLKRPVINYVGFIISICLSGSILFGTLFGEKELIVNKVELGFDRLPKSFDGYKLLHFSDIHLGSFIISKKVMIKAEQKIKDINPSVLMFTGDLVNNFGFEANGWDKIFQDINGTGKSFAILGNHDYGNYVNWDSDSAKEENFEEIIEAHQRFNFIVLRNENYKLKAGVDSIYVIGVENWGHPPFPQYADLGKAMQGVPENSFKILLTHDPAYWDSVIKKRQDIDLSLAGHTHGMQWGIKKAGITFSLIYFMRENWSGLYQSGKAKLYVNTGLGMVGMPWRINMPAELTLITLKRVEVD